MKRFRLTLAAASIVLIGLGCYMIYPPLCPLSIGLLLWIDLSLGNTDAKRKR